MTTPSPTATYPTVANLDSAAISLSALCLIHCLGAPFVLSVLPILAAGFEAEWLHKAFVVAAVAISLLALSRSSMVAPEQRG